MCWLLNSPALADVLPPDNDAIANAISLAGESFKLEADLGAATTEQNEPVQPGNFGQTAWWVWTSSTNGIVEWNSSGSSNRVAVSIFEADTFGQLLKVGVTYRRAVGQVTAWSVVPDEFGSFQARAGVTYFIQLDLSYSLPNGFGIPPPFLQPSGAPKDSKPVTVLFQRSATIDPINDEFAQRITLAGLPVDFVADLGAATSEPGEPRISTNTLGRTLWWTWTAHGFGTATIAAPDGGPAPVVGIYRRGTAQTLELIASSATTYSNECFSFQTAHQFVSWDVIDGETYEIQVDRFPEYVAQGPTPLRLTFEPAPPNDTLAGAIDLAGDDLSITASVVGATFRHDPVITGQTGANSVWYRWQPATRGILQVSRFEPIRYSDPSYTTNQNLGVDTFEVTRCGAFPTDVSPLQPFVPVFGMFQPVSFDNGLTTNYVMEAMGTNGFTVEVSTGTTRFIELDGADGRNPQTPLNLLFIPPPSNDDFENRITLPEAPVDVTGRTFAATFQPGDPAYFTDGARLTRSVWWQWNSPTAGRWMVFIHTGGYNENYFAVYRGATASSTSEVGGSMNEPIVFDCGAGELFQVGVFAQTQFGTGVQFSIVPVTTPNPTKILLQSGWVLLGIPDNSGLPYVVDQSSDLQQWTPVSTNSGAFSGWLPVPVEPTLPAQFFRTHLLDSGGAQ